MSDPAALQRICDQLGPEQIDALLRKWLARLPHPFTPDDREAGHRYDISILQAEFSLTQMLDKPVTGRVFFEQVIRDNLGAGRPGQISLIFDRRIQNRKRRPAPGQFRTKVITSGVTPSLHVDYKPALLIFRLLPRGFTNRDLRQLTAELRGLPAVTTGQMTYDLPAPRGALSYPRFSREELGGRFLGLMANPASKD